jgi:excisionase family DNA binding protein
MSRGLRTPSLCGRISDPKTKEKSMRKNQGIVVPFETCDLATRIEHWPHALTAPELADLLGLGKTAIYDLAKRGGIPHYRVAGSIRLDPATTAAWLREREVAFPERLAA